MDGSANTFKGGKNPVVVFEDADIDNAVTW